MMRRRLALFVLAIAAIGSEASAQPRPVCIQGTSMCGQVGADGRVVLEVPPIQVPIPSWKWGGGVRTPPPPGPSWQDQQMALAWKAYYDWEANLRARVAWDMNARLHAEARIVARLDPVWNHPVEIAPIPPKVPAGGFPALGLLPVALCFGQWTGPGAPSYVGYCPAIRARFGAFGVELDPDVLRVTEADRGYWLFGLSPGATITVLRGQGATLGSELYLSAGVNGYLPSAKDLVLPDAFLGARAGLGALAFSGPALVGVEWRATMRAGISAGDDPVARAAAKLRAGTEARVYFGFEL